MSMEIGCLVQGNDFGVSPTDTIDFIHTKEIPTDNKITYENFAADYRPLKPESNRIRCVVCVDKLEYQGDAIYPTTITIEAKLLINNVISDAKHGVRFLTCGLKDYFLASPMKNPQYMKMRWEHIPQGIKLRYNLQEKLNDGYIYIKSKNKCMD